MSEKPHQGKVFFHSEFSIPHSELIYKFPFSFFSCTPLDTGGPCLIRYLKYK